MFNVIITKIRFSAAASVFSNGASCCACVHKPRSQPGPQMLRFLLFPAVLAVVAYATLGGADFPDIIRFSFVLLIALCTAVIYAWAARAKRRSDNAR